MSNSTAETNEQLWFEQSINAAVYIGAMAWGVHVAVAYNAIRTIIYDKNKSSKIWLPFVGIVFLVSTINICSSINFNQLAWIDERGFPGGPLAFIVTQQNRPVNVAVLATSIITIFFADAFLIQRCHVLWQKLYITGILTLVLLASTIMSILHTVQASHATAVLWDETSLSFSIPYVSLAMSLNILLTIVLTWRLLDFRRRLPLTVTEDVRQKYNSIEALVVESALPYGIVSFIFVVLYGLGNTGSNLFVPLLVQLHGIIPDLIIIRRVQGHAWSTDTIRRVGPAVHMFRGPQGRAVQDDAQSANDVSMFAVGNNPSGHSLDTKVPMNVV